MYNLYFAIFGPILWAYSGYALWKCEDFSDKRSQGIMIYDNKTGSSFSVTTVGIIYWNEVIKNWDN